MKKLLLAYTKTKIAFSLLFTVIIGSIILDHNPQNEFCITTPNACESIFNLTKAFFIFEAVFFIECFAVSTILISIYLFITKKLKKK